MYGSKLAILAGNIVAPLAFNSLIFLINCVVEYKSKTNFGTLILGELQITWLTSSANRIN